MTVVKRSRLFPAFLFFILLLVIACEKETEPLTGQLIGYVSLYDNERKKMPDNGGVEVILEGSIPQIKALTDRNGQFVIDNLKSGTYNIIFDTEGYCRHKIIGYQFVGGNMPASAGRTAIFGVSDFQINDPDITVIFSLPHRVAFTVTAKTPGISGLCRYFVGNGSDVSYMKYSLTGVTAINNAHGERNIYFQFHVDPSKFPAGSNLSVIIYPATESHQYYTDINSNTKIYSSINVSKPSEVVNITIPGINSSR
jgi:hypothetical protein